MAERINQKQTLFKFVSIRPPELTNKETQHLKFVFHSSYDGVFFDAVKNRPFGQTKWGAMKIVAETFKAYTESDFEGREFTEYVTAASWIARNKKNVTPDEMYEKIKMLEPFKDAIIKNLWDNVFYQVVTQKSFYDKELINELLVLQNILINIKPPSKMMIGTDIILTLANARLVLPTELFVEDDTDDTMPKAIAVVEEPLFSAIAVDTARESAFAKYAIDRNVKAIDEIVELEKKYALEYNTAFESATKLYEEKLVAAYAAATPIKKEYTDCATRCTFSYFDYENLVLPVYVFNPPKEIDPGKFRDKLTKESYYVLESLKLLDKTTFSEIVQGVKASTKKYNEKIFTREATFQKTISVGGMAFNAEAEAS